MPSSCPDRLVLLLDVTSMSSPLVCAHTHDEVCGGRLPRRYEAVRSDRNLYSKNLIESQVLARCAASA